MKSLFSAGFCTDAKRRKRFAICSRAKTICAIRIRQLQLKFITTMLPRTGDRKTPTVLVSTASPYKFANSVLSAVKGEDAVGDDPFEMIGELAAVTGTPIPAPIAALEGKEVRFRNVCDRDDMQAMVYRLAGIE